MIYFTMNLTNYRLILIFMLIRQHHNKILTGKVFDIYFRKLNILQHIFTQKSELYGSMFETHPRLRINCVSNIRL